MAEKHTPWTRKAWRATQPADLTPGQSAAFELLWLSHKFERKSPEWMILAVAAHKLMFLGDKRPAHRPRRTAPDPAVQIAVTLCLCTSEKPARVARHVEEVLHPNKAGLDNRVDYLAKKTRSALKALSQQEAETIRTTWAPSILTWYAGKELSES